MKKTALGKTDILCYFISADPPTIGHLKTAKYGLSSLPTVKKLIVIPPASHVWGKKLASFTDRVNMLKLTFTRADPRIEISTIEKDLHLSGFTFDALKVIKKQNPKNKLGLLIGVDSLKTFTKWKNWQEILKTAAIFVSPRGKLPQSKHITKLSPELKPHLGNQLFFLPDHKHPKPDFLTISSSQTQKDLRKEGFSRTLTQTVNKYIEKRGLYQNHGQKT